MSRHAGHETNSARPRVSSPSRRRRASPGTTSDTVANRTIQATIPRRDPDIISGGEAARGVMTVPIEVPSRRRSAGIESGGDFASMVRLPSPRFQTRVARWTRRRAGRRTSPRRRPASGLTARSARVFETSACPSSSRRTSWSRRRCALAPPTDFSPPTPPSIANNDDSSPSPSPNPLPQIEFASVHLPRMCEAFDRARAADLPADHRDQSWSWVDDAVPAVVSVSRHPVVPRRRPNPSPIPDPTRPKSRILTARPYPPRFPARPSPQAFAAAVADHRRRAAAVASAMYAPGDAARDALERRVVAAVAAVAAARGPVALASVVAAFYARRLVDFAEAVRRRERGARSMDVDGETESDEEDDDMDVDGDGTGTGTGTGTSTGVLSSPRIRASR